MSQTSQKLTHSRSSKNILENIQFNPPKKLKQIHCLAHYSDQDMMDLKTNKEAGIHHIDSTFDYSYSKINIPEDFNPETSTIKWMSISKFFKKNKKKIFSLFNKKIDPSALCKKTQNFAGYMNAIQLLTNFPGFIERSINLEETENEVNAFVFKLNMGGIWTQYIIDDYIPVFFKELPEGEKSSFELIDGKEKFEFLYTGFLEGNEGDSCSETWLCLLEKVYAKAIGGYFKLKNIPFYEALTDFSGVPSIRYKLFGQENEMDIDTDDERFKFYGMKKNFGIMDDFWEFLQEKKSKDHAVVFYSDKKVEQEKFEILENFGYLMKTLSTQEEEERKVIILNKDNLEQSLTLDEISQIFSDFLILNMNPKLESNATHIELKSEILITSVVKIEIQEPGPYAISLTQKQNSAYLPYEFNYNNLSLTLGKLLEGEIAYIGHKISRNNERDLTLDFEFFEEGSYFALIDVESNLKNYQIQGDYEGDLQHWRDVTFTVLGEEFVRLDSLAREPNRQMIYDYLIHRVWKNYSKLRMDEGEKISLEVHEADHGDENESEEKKKEEVEVELSLIELPHLSIYKLENLSDFNLQIGKILKEKLPSDLECFGPFEVNSVDPWAVVNSKSHEILIFKYNDKIIGVEKFELNKKFEVIKSEAPFPEDCYGQDPYELMVKLYTVQPSRTYPTMFFDVPQSGLLLANLDYQKVLSRYQNMEMIEKGDFEVKKLVDQKSENFDDKGETTVKIKGKLDFEEDGKIKQESTQFQSGDVLDLSKRPQAEGEADVDSDDEFVKQKSEGDISKQFGKQAFKKIQEEEKRLFEMNDNKDEINDEDDLDPLDDKTKFEYIPSPKMESRQLDRSQKKKSIFENEKSPLEKLNKFKEDDHSGMRTPKSKDIVSESEDLIHREILPGLTPMPEQPCLVRKDQIKVNGDQSDNKFVKSRELTPVKKTMGDQVQLREKNLEFPQKPIKEKEMKIEENPESEKKPVKKEEKVENEKTIEPTENEKKPQKEKKEETEERSEKFDNPFKSFNHLNQSPKRKDEGHRKLEREKTPRKRILLNRPVSPIQMEGRQHTFLPNRLFLTKPITFSRNITTPLPSRVEVVHYSPKQITKVEYVHPDLIHRKTPISRNSSRSKTPIKYGSKLVKNGVNGKSRRIKTAKLVHNTPSLTPQKLPQTSRSIRRVSKSPSNIVRITYSPSHRQRPITPIKAQTRRVVITDTKRTPNQTRGYTYRPPIYIPPPMYVGTYNSNKVTTTVTTNVNLRSMRNVSRSKSPIMRVAGSRRQVYRRPEYVKSPIVRRIDQPNQRIVVDGRPRVSRRIR